MTETRVWFALLREGGVTMETLVVQPYISHFTPCADPSGFQPTPDELAELQRSLQRGEQPTALVLHGVRFMVMQSVVPEFVVGVCVRPGVSNVHQVVVIACTSGLAVAFYPQAIPDGVELALQAVRREGERLGLTREDAADGEEAAADRHVFCWGAVVGSRQRECEMRPTPFLALPAGVVVTALACGQEHAVILTDLGRVLGVGDNSRGAVGAPGVEWAQSPVPISALDAQRVCGVAAGLSHSVCVTRNGDVFVWGDSREGRLGLGGDAVGNVAATEAVAEVEAGREWTPFSTEPVPAAGAPVAGAEAEPEPEPPAAPKRRWRFDPRKPPAAAPPRPAARLTTRVHLRPRGSAVVAEPTRVEVLRAEHVAEVAAGGSHTLFLLTDGRVFGCGARRGWGGAGAASAPELLRVPVDRAPVTAVRAGDGHSVALDSAGAVFVAGTDFRGQQALGGSRGSAAEHDWHRASGLEGKRVRFVACGAEHTVVVTGDNEVLAWGANDRHQCGESPLREVCRAERMAVPAGEDDAVPVQVVAGAKHTLLLLSSGQLLAAGAGAHGQTGVGNSDTVEALAAVAAPEGVAFCSVAAAGDASFASSEARMLPLGRDLLTQLPSEDSPGDGLVALVAADGERVLVHRALLAARAEGMRASVSAEAGEEVVVPASAEATRALAAFLYGGSRFIQARLEDLAEAAAALGVHELAELCAAAAAAGTHAPRLPADMAWLAQSGCAADVFFSAQGRRVAAHKFVLAARCPYLHTMLESGMAESFADEVPLHECPPDAFELLLHWVYCDELPADTDPATAVDAMEVAHAFGLEALAVACGSVVEKVVDEDNVLPIFARADFFGIDELAEFCVSFCAGLASAFGVAELEAALDAEQVESFVEKAGRRGWVVVGASGGSSGSVGSSG